MSSHALAGVLSNSAQNNNNLSSPTGATGYQQQKQHYSNVAANTRKMDRVFTQSMLSQTAPPPRYMRNNRRMMSGGGGMEYMVAPGGMESVGSAGSMYQQMPTHYRTISGSGGVDEYDYAPPQSMNYYVRGPARRRMRGAGGAQMQGSYMMRQQGDMGNRRYNGPRRAGMRNQQRQMYDEGGMPNMRVRYRKDSMRSSFRNGDNYMNDERNMARGKPRRRRRSTRTRYSQSEQQQQQQQGTNRGVNQNGNDDKGRRRNSSRRRRRRTNSSITAAASNGGQTKSDQPKAQTVPRSTSASGGAVLSNNNRNRRFMCNICKQSFRTESLRVRHLRLFHPRRRDFVCKQCRGVFPTAKSITVHLSVPHTEERQPVAEIRRQAKPGVPTRYLPDNVSIFSCKYCPFAFLSSNDAESHQTRCRASQRISINMDLEYPGNDQFVVYCFCCPELLSVHQNMQEHFKCLHNFVNLKISYYCSICGTGKKFDNETNAAEHFKRAHTDKQIEEFRNKRRDEYIEDSLKSYQTQRPVSMLRVKAEVRQVMNKLLRQVSSTLKATS